MHKYYKTTVSIQEKPAVSNVMLQMAAAVFRHIQKIAKNGYYLCHTCLSNSAPTRRIFKKFDILSVF
jgi:hypothetical protein